MKSEWREYLLGDLYNFSSGLSKNSKEFGFGKPFLSFKTVFNNYILPEELPDLVNSNMDEQERCSIMKGDVFLTRTSETLNELGMSSVALRDYPEATFNGFTKRLRPKGKQIYPLYVAYYMRSPYFRANINSMASMTTRASLNNDILSRLPIQVPTFEEQKKIGDILYSFDKKIKLNHRINDNLEQQAQAIFRSRFLTQESLHDGWVKFTLGDVSLMGAGGDKPKTVSAVQTESCPYPIYSNGISDEGLYGFTNEYKIADESITVSARGTIGYVCLRHLPYTPIVRLVTLIPKKEVVSAKYLYLWLRNTHIHGTGTTQQQLTVPDFRKTEIILPTKEEMASFTDVVSPLFETMWANQAENAKLADLRDTLLPRLMSGELDVSSLDL